MLASHMEINSPSKSKTSPLLSSSLLSFPLSSSWARNQEATSWSRIRNNYHCPCITSFLFTWTHNFLSNPNVNVINNRLMIVHNETINHQRYESEMKRDGMLPSHFGKINVWSTRQFSLLCMWPWIWREGWSITVKPPSTSTTINALIFTRVLV